MRLGRIMFDAYVAILDPEALRTRRLRRRRPAPQRRLRLDHRPGGRRLPDRSSARPPTRATTTASTASTSAPSRAPPPSFRPAAGRAKPSSSPSSAIPPARSGNPSPCQPTPRGLSRCFAEQRRPVRALAALDPVSPAESASRERTQRGRKDAIALPPLPCAVHGVLDEGGNRRIGSSSPPRRTRTSRSASIARAPPLAARSGAHPSCDADGQVTRQQRRPGRAGQHHQLDMPGRRRLPRPDPRPPPPQRTGLHLPHRGHRQDPGHRRHPAGRRAHQRARNGRPSPSRAATATPPWSTSPAKTSAATPCSKPARLPAGVTMHARRFPSRSISLSRSSSRPRRTPRSPAACIRFTSAPPATSPPLTGPLHDTIHHVEINNQGAYHSASFDRIATAVIDEAPFQIDLEAPAVPIVKNGTLALKVRATRKRRLRRKDHPPLPVETARHRRPRSPSTFPATNPRPATNSTPTATPPVAEWQVCILAEANTPQGPVLVSSALVPLQSRRALPRHDPRHGRHRAGQGHRHAREDRKQNPFAGDATVELLGLPHGVTTPLQNFTKDQTELTFPIKVAADAAVGKHNGLFCRVTVPENGTTILHQPARAAPCASTSPPRPPPPKPKPNQPRKTPPNPGQDRKTPLPPRTTPPTREIVFRASVVQGLEEGGERGCDHRSLRVPSTPPPESSIPLALADGSPSIRRFPKLRCSTLP